jgi:hypothetical protein
MYVLDLKIRISAELKCLILWQCKNVLLKIAHVVLKSLTELQLLSKRMVEMSDFTTERLTTNAPSARQK